jgi:hypothetical protein
VQLAVLVPDRGSDGDEFRHGGAPVMTAELETHADDACGDIALARIQ